MDDLSVDALAAIMNAVRLGHITPSEAGFFTNLVATHVRVAQDAENEERLEKIEKELKDLTQ